jgi:hypothetical protein
MVETVEQFYERIYVNFVNDKVFVFNCKSDITKEDIKGKIWTVSQASQYVQWLKQKPTTNNFMDNIKKGVLQ